MIQINTNQLTCPLSQIPCRHQLSAGCCDWLPAVKLQCSPGHSHAENPQPTCELPLARLRSTSGFDDQARHSIRSIFKTTIL